MASNEVRVKAPNGGYEYIIKIAANELARTEQETLDNESRVTVTGSITSTGTNFAGRSKHKLKIFWVDDYKQTDENKILSEKLVLSIDLYGTVDLSQTITAKHKPDGTLNGYAKVIFEKGGVNNWAPNTTEVYSGWFSLNTIPRATKLSNKSATIGLSTNISWSRASDKFTHTLQYSFGEFSETIGTGLGTNVDWTPGTKLYKSMSGVSGTGTLTLITYNGSTEIGRSSSTLTLYASESTAKPVITYGNARDNNNTTINLTGNANTLVLNASQTYIVIHFTAKHYSKIKSLKINGTSYSVPSGSVSGSDTNYNFDKVLGTSTTGKYDIIITDTRDYPVTYSFTKPTINYIVLDYKINFKRIAPTTGEVGVTFDGNYFNGGFGNYNNLLKIDYVYKKRNESSYSAPITLVNNQDYVISGNGFHSGSGSYKTQLKLNILFDYKFAYDLQFRFEDRLTYRVVNLIVVKGIPIIWWNDEKFTVNGELHIADSNGQNDINVLQKLNQMQDEINQLKNRL